MFFLKYCIVGLFNTIVHWIVFFYFFIFLDFEQSNSNFIGFCVSNVIGCFINCNWTFKINFNLTKLAYYFFFMGVISFLVGLFADRLSILPFFTLMVTSIVSMSVGFIFSKYLFLKRAK